MVQILSVKHSAVIGLLAHNVQEHPQLEVVRDVRTKELRVPSLHDKAVNKLAICLHTFKIYITIQVRDEEQYVQRCLLFLFRCDSTV